MTVPVLSRQTWRIRRKRSSTEKSVRTIPRRLKSENARRMTTGVASPSAQGQATTSTATIREMPSGKPVPLHPRASPASDKAITTGKKPAAIRLAKRDQQ
ncbi:MAG: hypothetical protein ABIK89_26185 [Planctomycetota bacterium]